MMMITCKIDDCIHNVESICMIEDEVEIIMDATDWEWIGFCNSYEVKEEENND